MLIHKGAVKCFFLSFTFFLKIAKLQHKLTTTKLKRKYNSTTHKRQEQMIPGGGGLPYETYGDARRKL